jgi:queuine tRNA-ribosyltransferase
VFVLRATASGSRARTGVLTTLHGTVETPVFMPVGTRGTVRTQTAYQLKALGAPILLANTYHLMLRPGAATFEQFGGLHKWSGWNGSILTDSGGFQVFSLGASTTEDGAQLRNPNDGTTLHMTPETSIAMQRAIGSDIMMVLDQCIDSTSPLSVARAAMERTHRWARRSLAARGDSPQALFAIVQGACFEELRRESAEDLTSVDGFDGYAIGGLAVGESKAQREDICELTAQLLPMNKPRYLMGVGTPLDILEAVHRGVDMFDCIMPTAWAQHARVFTSHGRLDMRRGVYALSDEPLDAACGCETCTTYSRSYLHHLIKSSEPLGWQLLATHNLHFYVGLMREIREHITANTFAAFYAEKRIALASPDMDNPPEPPPRKAGKSATRGAFSLHRSRDGYSSIQHVASGEIMHSVNQPDAEAERVYVAQSQHIAAALRGERSLVVWDVGLGAAHNAMALVRALEASAAPAAVEIISFEHDLDAIRLALSHLKHFAHLRHRAPHLLVENGRVESERFTWHLHEGDFATQFTKAPPPDVIFYDPFSTKVDGPLWSLSLFRELYAHLARPAELFTYSASTAVRTSLLAAGFHVARGVASGPKEETTIALKGVATGYDLLDHTWLARRARSTAKFATDIPVELHDAIERAIQAHAQFTAQRP